MHIIIDTVNIIGPLSAHILVQQTTGISIPTVIPPVMFENHISGEVWLSHRCGFQRHNHKTSNISSTLVGNKIADN